MKRKLACADFTFPLLKHDQSLDVIAMLGFDGVDIGLFESRSHLWPSREFRQLTRSARSLARKVGDRGLQVADVFLQMDADFVPYASNHPQRSRRRKARDWFMKTLDYATACGCRHITTLPGVHFDTEKPADSFARCVDELSWRVAQADNADIVFAVEAHVGSIVPRPKATKKLVDAVPGLTLTLDYTHFTRLGLPDAEVEPLVPYASHCHIRGARRGRLQTSLRDNVIDYARVLRKMDEAKYRGWLGIEFVWIDWEHCNECDNLSETILFRDHIRELNRN